MMAASGDAAATGSQHGSFVFPDGGRYEGQFTTHDGKIVRHGRGKFADAHISYEGDWQVDKMHGEGSFVGASGAAYIGHFDGNQFSGSGEYRWRDGAVYKGAWLQNRMHGSGTYTSPDGMSWTGEFVNGLYVNGKAHVALR